MSTVEPSFDPLAPFIYVQWNLIKLREHIPKIWHTKAVQTRKALQVEGLCQSC